MDGNNVAAVSFVKDYQYKIQTNWSSSRFFSNIIIQYSFPLHYLHANAPRAIYAHD